MKKVFLLLAVPVISFSFMLYNCYPTYRAAKIEPDSLNNGIYQNLQAKIFTTDKRILLFPKGFAVSRGSVKGPGQIIKYDMGKSYESLIECPIDSIVAMTTYTETT